MQIFLNLLEIIILPGSFAGFFLQNFIPAKICRTLWKFEATDSSVCKKKTTLNEFTKNCYIAGVMG